MRCLLMTICLALFSTELRAQTSDPDWPCVQVLVPEISAAVLWPEVIDREVIGNWRDNETVSVLARQLGDLDEVTDRERESIASFAESLGQDASRLQNLNLLADGILTVTNQLRSRYIDGIKRYTRQQITIASQIEATLNQLAALDSSTDSSITDKRGEIEETLYWHERVFDQRENAIRALCESPVELEERLSDVIRELVQYLP